MARTSLAFNRYKRGDINRKELHRLWCNAYVVTNSFAEATRRIYGKDVKNADSKGRSLYNQMEVRDTLRNIMMLHGITPFRTAFVMDEALAADKISTDKDGNITHEPDHASRLRAADMILKIFDAYPTAKNEVTVTSESKHLHIYLQEPLHVKKFIVEHGRMPTDDERKVIDVESVDIE